MGLRGDSDHAPDPATAAIVAPGALTHILRQLARAPARQCPLLLPGGRVGRYAIIRAIGHGGFGTVYEAHDTALNRLVALKVQHLSEAADPEAAQEAETAARLGHPNIAALHDAGLLECGSPYLVYELLRGETLESRLSRGPISPRAALAIATEVACALVHAHAQGVVHRDLKPGNVFLTAEGEVKVLDFGVALLFGRSAPGGGTPGYMAPEQRRGDAEDARTDLYGLGLVLQEMLKGAATAVPAASAPPAAVQRVLQRLLAEDPEARPRSARAAVAELETAARAIPTRRTQRRRIVVASAAALAVAVAVGGVLALREHWPPRATVSAGAIPSIAVLPFADVSPANDQEYFADGLAEGILNALSQLEGLHVAGRTSAFSFKNAGADLRAIATKLNVGAVLEGSVRRAGTRVRVTARLVSVSDGYHLWSDTYDRELSNVFGVQDEIARAVVVALKVKLLPGRMPASPHRTTSTDAYNAYLLARELFHRGSEEGFRRAVDAYRKALALDPSYAPAWAGLAVALEHRAPVDAKEDRKRAIAAAERAVRLAPELADGFAARALLRMSSQQDWTGAESDLKRAIELDPGDPQNHRWQADLLASLGRLAEAIAALHRATDVEPLDASLWNALGWKYMADDQLGLAIQALNRALEIAPDHAHARRNLAVAFVLDGRPADALGIIHRAYKGDDVHRLLAFALAHHQLGHRRRSQQARDALVAKHASEAAYQVAEIHAWRGENDQAFAWLDKAYANADGGLRFLKYDPLLRRLRDDPRYAALLGKMKLPAD